MEDKCASYCLKKLRASFTVISKLKYYLNLENLIQIYEYYSLIESHLRSELWYGIIEIKC